MRNIQAQGILIKKNLVGEGDNFVTWYTRDHGKIQTKVKGAQKVTGRFTGHLEYLNLCNLEIYRGPKNLILINCTATETFPEIKNNFEKLDLGVHIIKTINAITYEEEATQKLFHLILETLNLITSENNPDLIIDCFKLKLIKLLGLLPNIRECTYCSYNFKINQEIFLTNTGSITCKKCNETTKSNTQISTDNFKLLNFTQSSSFQQILSLKISPEQTENFHSLIESFFRLHFPENYKSYCSS